MSQQALKFWVFTNCLLFIFQAYSSCLISFGLFLLYLAGEGYLTNRYRLVSIFVYHFVIGLFWSILAGNGKLIIMFLCFLVASTIYLSSDEAGCD